MRLLSYIANLARSMSAYASPKFSLWAKKTLAAAYVMGLDGPGTDGPVAELRVPELSTVKASNVPPVV